MFFLCFYLKLSSLAFVQHKTTTGIHNCLPEMKQEKEEIQCMKLENFLANLPGASEEVQAFQNS